jgi:hypothetical protein
MPDPPENSGRPGHIGGTWPGDLPGTDKTLELTHKTSGELEKVQSLGRASSGG